MGIQYKRRERKATISRAALGPIHPSFLHTINFFLYKLRRMKGLSIAIVFATCFFTGLHAQITITAAEAKDHINQIVSICDKIVDGRYLESSATKPTLLNVGGTYPDNIFTIVINSASRPNFSFKPEEYYVNKRVCVTGKLSEYNGKPQIVVLSPAEILISEQKDASVASDASLSTEVKQQAEVSNNKSELSVDSVKVENKQTLDVQSGAAVKSQSVAKPSAPVVKAEIKPSATENDKSKTSISETTPKPAPVVDNVYTIKLTGSVNLRAAPADNAEVLDLAKPGTIVSILNSANGWSKVEYSRYSSEQKRDLSFKGYINNRVLK
jgi:DNA/RNA endonuclease YhcR with UshA esterase domain